MTYRIVRTDDNNVNLEDEEGNVINSFEPPVRVPEDIIDDIMNHAGLDEAQRQVFKTVLTKDWKMVDDR